MTRMFMKASSVERPGEDEIRKGRVEAARQCRVWTEIPDDLVPRGRGLFVSAGTDHVYRETRGVTFATASVRIIADQATYHFTVSPDDALAFYERLPRTWTEILTRRARSRAPAPRRPRRSAA